jgi:hypothetical protein
MHEDIMVDLWLEDNYSEQEGRYSEDSFDGAPQNYREPFEDDFDAWDMSDLGDRMGAS